MAKSKLRVMVTRDRKFLWNTFGPFKVWLVGYARNPLIVYFNTAELYYHGDPLDSGIRPFVKDGTANQCANINRPYWVARLIGYGLDHGWNPEVAGMTVDDGIPWLIEMTSQSEPLAPSPLDQ